MLAAVLFFLPFGNGQTEPATAAQAEPTRPGAGVASPIEPPPLIQEASTETALPKKSDKALKEEAWERWYKKPSRCERITDGNRVECANLYIAAKRRFEHLYAAGKVK